MLLSPAVNVPNSITNQHRTLHCVWMRLMVWLYHLSSSFTQLSSQRQLLFPKLLVTSSPHPTSSTCTLTLNYPSQECTELGTQPIRYSLCDWMWIHMPRRVCLYIMQWCLSMQLYLSHQPRKHSTQNIWYARCGNFCVYVTHFQPCLYSSTVIIKFW